jgi:hypothetical protein
MDSDSDLDSEALPLALAVPHCQWYYWHSGELVLLSLTGRLRLPVHTARRRRQRRKVPLPVSVPPAVPAALAPLLETCQCQWAPVECCDCHQLELQMPGIAVCYRKTTGRQNM